MAQPPQRILVRSLQTRYPRPKLNGQTEVITTPSVESKCALGTPRPHVSPGVKGNRRSNREPLIHLRCQSELQNLVTGTGEVITIPNLRSYALPNAWPLPPSHRLIPSPAGTRCHGALWRTVVLRPCWCDTAQ